MSDGDIRKRKDEHIELCAREDVEYRLTTTLLEQVRLLHRSLPEIAMDELDLSCVAFGKRLSAPVCISGMTGGTEEAGAINRTLATVAEERGLAFGVGSQRAMLIHPELTPTFAVRDVAPNVLLLSNIGVVQATSSSSETVAALVDDIGADALCVHMNPAQELIQEHGDRDFRGNADALARLAADLRVPVIGKETGCGISAITAEQLRRANLDWCDVSGAGGTTWVGVEALRARPGRKLVGEDFWEWGVPTAPSIVFARRAGLNVIASGGIRNGHDVARALALGATLASMALPFIRAVKTGGADAVHAVVDRVLDGLRVAMILTGCQRPHELADVPRHIGPLLERWIV